MIRRPGLMQISSPTQAPSALLEVPPENGKGNIENFSGDWGHKTQKKNRLGFFAKLLSGLELRGSTAKSKAGPESAAENSETESPQKAKKNALKAGPVKAPVAGEKTEIFAFFRQDTEPKPLQTGLGNVRSTRNSFREVNLKDVTADDAARTKDEHQDLKLPLPSPKTPETPGPPAKAKNRPAAEPVSTKNGDAKFLADLVLSERRLEVQPPEQAQGAGSNRGRKGRSSIEFRDLRTGEIRDAASQGSVKEPFSLKSAGVEIEIPVNLKLTAGGSEGDADGKAVANAALSADNEAPQSKLFEDALARELRGDLSTDIIRDATVIARNGGEGTIRLSLRPASLGDVKIRLEMTENKITGHIVVESNEALRAFQKELPVLEKAFKDSGFNETNLEMSLAWGNSAEGWNFGSKDERFENDFSALPPVMAASRYEAETDRLDMGPEESSFSGGMIFPASPGRPVVNLLV
jgi:flagellar hook-length control protein FliK